jgi:Skp family chaperone for outer membrane proteins
MIKLMRMFALSLLVLPLSVLAEVKVGFDNTARLREEAPQAQDASRQMETEFAPRE